MENNQSEPVVSSVAFKGLDEVTHEAHVAQPSEAATEPTDPLPLQAHVDATHPEDVCITKEEPSQTKEPPEAASESREASAQSTPAVSTLTPAPSTQSYVPPVKRFSAVNINKKFLQKNQSSGAGTSSSSAASSNKQTGVIARPAPQTTPSHSRLVTAKLTATPAVSSPGPGWSRPNSVTPPAPSPTNASGLSKGGTPSTAPSGGHGPIQLAPAPGGKIIQPQARSVLTQKADSTAGSGKHAWRSVQPGANADSKAQTDFPTAAEAAKGRSMKLTDVKTSTDASEAQKQAMSETADAFRGVHLDPNAHHWDEMEEDDNDDFLGGVIEFGDGRQYTIQVNDGTKVDPKAREDGSGKPGSEGPVSKEERFVDDFDRSWPRSRPEHGNSAFHDGPGAHHKDESGRRSRTSFSETSSNFSVHSPVSIRDGSQSRVLFNERLNRMEPYSGSRPGPGGVGVTPAPPPHGAPFRRNGPEASGVLNSRLERDTPPHSVQVLQKSPRDFPHGHDDARRPHHFGDSRRDYEGPESGSSVTRFSGDDHHKGRREWGSSGTMHHDALPSGRPFGSRDTSVSRETINGASSVTSSDGHGSGHFSLTRGSQHWGHIPSGHSRDMERQLPPHLMHSRSTFPEHSAAEADASRRSEYHAPPDVPPEPRAAKIQKPLPLTHGTDAKLDDAASRASFASPAGSSPADVEALRKAFLADSAERAKKRRQAEEEERERAQERARKKAAELEAKLAVAKAAEEKKAHEAKPEPQPAIAPVTTSEPKPETSRPTEAEVLSVIEEAIKSTAPSDDARSTDKADEPSGSEAAVIRPPFCRGPTHRDSSRLSAVLGAHGSPQPRRPPYIPIADQADSWRARAKPPMLPVQNSKNDISHDPAMATLPAVQAFDLQPDESMEVIDFNDIGRLVGERPSPRTIPAASGESLGWVKPQRSVASDFFEDAGENSEPESWRRVGNMPNKSYSDTVENGPGRSSHQEPPSSDASEVESAWQVVDVESKEFISSAHSPLKTPSSPNDGVSSSYAPNHFGHPPASPGIPRYLKSPNMSYREAPLSALDDTMSRIKGALDGMHSSAAGQMNKDSGTTCSLLQPPTASTQGAPATICGPPKREKWLPPALRPEQAHKRTETFEFTRPEPPRSPAPSDNRFPIRLPTSSRRIEPLTKKQLNSIKSFSGPVRWEILSFDPPMEGMTKRNLSVNDVLFRRPPGVYKAKKFRVLLPSAKRTPRPHVGGDVQSLPRVNVPVGSGLKDSSVGAFGRPRMADMGNWRAAPPGSSPQGDISVERLASTELHVTSRSPPPDLAPTYPSVSSGFSHDRTASKTKSSQKSLDGCEVAFYRDTRKQSDSVPISVVTFTVSSELEGDADFSLPTKSPKSAEASKASEDNAAEATAKTDGPRVDATPLAFPAPIQAKSNSASSASLSTASPSMATQPMCPGGTENKALEQQSDPLLRSHPITPPPQNTPSTWAKSPARVPDPEHLKAVWSQTSDRESLPTVNSLKSIADDLTAVPFTLQEVKSEGGTPPPPGPVAPPTRMSASEVTRAFQTVPSGPSNSMSSSSLRGNQMSVHESPMSAHRPLKPTAIGLPPPSLNPSVPRPHYIGYPASMNSHSPSPPTLVYSHVMPNGMPASPATPYGQPIWMPLVHQQGPTMVRAQPSSPYSPSLMPYHVPGPQNGMFPPPPNSMPTPQGSPASYPSAPPSQMMVSPVLPQSTPVPVPPHMMYAGSPMLMPIPPPGGVPQPRPYPGVVGMGRGSMPGSMSPMDSRQHPTSGPPSASRFHNPGYTPVPPQSFVRPW